ncbi:hypothetical protein Ocin01_09494 [Orchesella cincta]|uniref:Uncharacterized protein n=1 Tax=Orchesella cincta TaxID=48709 RepID=A0A1D2MW19_ORCCI|nr:hypothetical protein Ocin01_09494 [Orchesella cincta]
MVSFKSLFVVTFVTVLSFSKQACCTQQNASSISSERSGRQSSVNVDTSVNSPSSSYSIFPSSSYQFHTNDHEHLDQIVSSHHTVVANSFNSDDATNAQNQDSISSASINQARISSGTKSAPAYYYPTFDSYQRQENYTSENAQQNRVSEKKEQVLKQSQPNPDSAPEAFLDQKYTSQTVQVGNSAAAPIPSSPITATEGSSSYQPQQSGKQSTNSNLTWNPIASKRNLTSSSSAYLRPPKIHQRSDSSPVTYQIRQSLQHTAPRYMNVVPQPAAGASSKRSLSTNPEAYKPMPKQKRRKILQSRADTYAHDEDGDADEQSDNGGEEENQEDDNEQDTNNEEYYSQYNNLYDPDSPQLKELGFPPGGGFGSPFTGPGGPLDALPPPPPALKGSIDYILIPLILIGLAGPIFVVLYVILGAFEARLSPIQRSLNSGYSEYKPYIDSLTSSVGRALEQYECFDYAVCHFGGISSSLGLSRSTSAAIESALTSATPKEYVPTLRRLFSIMETPKGDCKKYKCSAMADQFPVNF